MKKSHIVATVTAIFGCATSALHAEGLYTYALIDGGIASTKISGSSLPSPSSKTEFVTGGYSPTFIGMTYEKGVSGGLTVGTQLEQGFSINPADGSNSHYAFGNGDLLNRQANIYIKSGAGTFVVGTQPNFAFKTVLLGEPRAGANFGSALAMIDVKGNLSTVDDAALSYTSVPVKDVTFGVQYVPETKSAKSCATCYDVKTGSRVTLGYASGPLSAGLAFYDNTLFTSTTSPSATTKASGSIASGAYKIGAFTLKGLYTSQKTVSSGPSIHTTGVGGAYALTAETTLDLGLYTSSGGTYKSTATGLGVQQKLTKELTLYGQLAKVDNKSSGADLAFINFAGPTILTNSLSKGQSANSLNIGLSLALF